MTTLDMIVMASGFVWLLALCVLYLVVRSGDKRDKGQRR